MSPTRLVLGLMCLLAVSDLQARPPLDVLLPEATRVFVACTDLPKTVKSFDKTQFGRLLEDRQLKAFKADLQAQLKKQASLDFLGLSLEEVCAMSGGETGWGVIEVERGKMGHLLFVDVTGKNDVLRKYLLRQAQHSQQGELRKETIGGVTVVAVSRPAVDGKPAGLRGGFVKDNLLVIGDNLDLLRGVLGRWSGNQAGSLAAAAIYVETFERCRPQTGETGQVRFFVDPLYLAKMDRPPARTRAKKDPVELILRQGFEAIKGVGGFVTFDTPSHDVFYRVAVYAPPPYARGMRMLCFPNCETFPPEPWLPANPASMYLTFNWDLVNAFDAFDTVFDSLSADEVPGTFKEILDSLKNDPDGPRLDMRQDIVAELTNRVTYFIDNAGPLDKTSRRIVAGLATKNAKTVEAAVGRFLRGDPHVRRRMIRNQVVWEVLPRQAPGKPDSRDKRGEARPPSGGIAVAYNQLFFATHLDLLETVLRNEEDRPRLGEQEDFRRVQTGLDRLGGAKTIGRLFCRPAEDVRVGYELIRTGQVERAESLYGRLLRLLLRGEDGTVRLEPRGDLLPEFNKISHHFTAAGGVARNCPGGWEFSGFALKKGGDMP
jgi:hypothetical protein